MPYDTLTLESTGPVTVLTLNRPRQSNSLNGQLLLDLKNALDEVDQSGARCLLITGAGKAFCGGADLLSSQANPDGLSVGDGIAFAMDQRYHPVLRRLKELRVPTVAAVNGACAVGGLGGALRAPPAGGCAPRAPFVADACWLRAASAAAASSRGSGANHVSCEPWRPGSLRSFANATSRPDGNRA